MKRTVIAALTLFIAIAAIGCGAQKDDNLDIIGGADGPTSIFLASKSKEDKALSWLYEKGRINVIWGDKIYSKDTHGGFHGDGSSLYSYRFTDSSMEPEMEESEYWKGLPLSEAVSNLINNSIGDECAEAIQEKPCLDRAFLYVLYKMLNTKSFHEEEYLCFLCGYIDRRHFLRRRHTWRTLRLLNFISREMKLHCRRLTPNMVPTVSVLLRISSKAGKIQKNV